jgi:hypothetical protein
MEMENRARKFMVIVLGCEALLMAAIYVMLSLRGWFAVRNSKVNRLHLPKFHSSWVRITDLSIFQFHGAEQRYFSGFNLDGMHFSILSTERNHIAKDSAAFLSADRSNNE